MKEKIKKIISKYDIVFMILSISSILLNVCFRFTLKATDEIWVFQNIYKIYNGFIVYKDINIITTPMFYYIGNVLFNILGANIFVFRIYNVIIYLTLYMCIYTLFKRLEVPKTRSYIYTMVCLFLFTRIIGGGASYNILAIVFVVIGIILEIDRNKSENKLKYNILQGIIVFFIFMTKQNIGIYFVLGLIIERICIYKNISKTIRSLLLTGSISLLLVAGYIIQLIQSNNLYNFINYVFLGIGEFTNNAKIEYLAVATLLSIVSIYIFLVALIFKNKKVELKQEEYTNIQILVCITLPIILVVYPLLNGFHLDMIMMLIYIGIMYMLEIIFLKHVLEDTKVANYIAGAMAVLFTILILVDINFLFYYSNKFKSENEYAHPYFGAIIEEEMQNNIDEVLSYIKENDKEVIVFSEEAALYMVPLKRSNGAMDLPFLGNMGENGENNMIKQIEEMKNTEFLITEEKTMYQESDKIREYIKEKLIYKGKINKYDIYQTNE